MSDLLAEARALMAQGRAADALSRLEHLPADAPAVAHHFHSQALKAVGRMEDAVAPARRAADLSPTGVAYRHNLAAILGDLDRNAEAEAAARQALAIGGDAPETWLVLGRALQGLNRFDEADAAYRAAVQRRPGYADALKELSQLIWMRTGEVKAATAELDAAIAAAPGDPQLRIVKARLLDYAGRPEAAYAALTQGPLNPAGELTAAQLALQIAPARALAHARRIEASAPTAHPVRLVLAEAHLALGQPDQALTYLQALGAAAPLDQYVIALTATAWRMTGDARYGALYDYDAFVRPSVIDTPDGWPDLPTYLADLKQTLVALHSLKTHPVGQSLRGGSQTTAALKRSDDPVIQAFFQAIDGPIRRYMEAVGQGGDALRSRNTGAYAIAGSWSVRLRPNGFHADHVHPQGWLSSACYIDLPDSVEGAGQEGWIQFGHPAIPTPTPLPAEHVVKPQPGTLVLFPSYMWHGTIPFGGDQHRLTIAFDVVPS